MTNYEISETLELDTENQTEVEFDVTVDHTNFLKTLSHVQSIVERRSIIPVLSHVLIEAQDGVLSMTATDMNTTLIETIDANISVPGTVLVPAHLLYDIARKVSSKKLSLRTNTTRPNTIDITADTAVFSLQYLDTQEFPKVDYTGLEYEISFSSKLLASIFDKTYYAAGEDKNRSYLNGVYIEFDQGSTTSPLAKFVATDGHRLAYAELPIPEGFPGSAPSMIVPKKTIQELAKMLDGQSGETKISFSSNKILFSFSRINMVSKLIDASYVDYKLIIPQNNNMVMKVSREQLINSIDRVIVLSAEDEKGVKFSLRDNILTIKTPSDHIGYATEDLEVEYSGDPIDCKLNSAYLFDVLRSTNDKEVIFVMDHSASPIIVKSPDPDSHSLDVIMPLRG